MLWNAETSTHPPSSAELYKTMPPNHYTQRNKDFMSQIESPVAEESTTFRINIDVSHYLPEEILVTLEDGKLVVNGKHFSESEYGFESCQFHRRYPIPEGLKKSELTSRMTDDGILIITSKCMPPEVKPKPPSTVRIRITQYDTPPNTPPSSRSPRPPRNTSPTLDTSSDSSGYSSHVNENEFKEINSNTFMLSLHCKGYSPEDVRVKISGGELIVHGRQKINICEGRHERIRHKEFRKRYSMPINANCDTLISKMTDDDVLYVEVKKFQRFRSRENLLSVNSDDSL